MAIKTRLRHFLAASEGSLQRSHRVIGVYGMLGHVRLGIVAGDPRHGHKQDEYRHDYSDSEYGANNPRPSLKPIHVSSLF